MKHQGALRTALLSCLAFFSAWPAMGASLSLSEYRAQLRELTAKVDALESHPERAAETETAIPDKVAVNTGEREITVSYRDLKNDLASFYAADSAKRSTMLPQIQSYLRALSEGAAEHNVETDPEAARKKLAEILARREFHTSSGPGPGAILLAKILRWLERLLRRPLSGGSNFQWFEVLVYSLIGLALLLLLFWTLRRLRRAQDEPAPREIIPFAPSAKSWRVWLADARALAQQQDWRNAIHLAYWAGISFLEEHGAWKPNRARTPREYLRLIGSRTANYAALAALTRKFEIVWYGRHDAAEPDFQETLGALEKLGCR